MSLRPLLSGWDSQPQESVGVDYPRTDFAWLASVGTLVGPHPGVVTASRAGTAGGIAASSGYVGLSSTIPSMYQTTWFQAGVVLLDGTSETRVLSARDTGQAVIFSPSTPKVNLVLWTLVDVNISGGTLPTGIVHYVARRIGPSHSVWLDGRLYGTATEASAPVGASVLPAIGAEAASGARSGLGTLTASNGVLAVVRSPEVPSDARCLEISANVYQLFAPRTIWVPVSAPSGTPTLSLPTLTSIGTTTARPRVSVTF